MNQISDKLKKNRPSLSASSLKTYTSILKSVYKSIYPEDKEIEMKKFDDAHKIFAHFKDIEFNKRKTYMSALYILTEKKEYKNLMMQDIAKYKADQLKQEPTETQKNNWVTQAEIKEVYDKYAKNVKLLLAKNEPLTVKELQYYQSYIILALMSGIFIDPERLLDWVDFKIKNINKEKDNYFQASKKGRATIYKDVFNSYKTFKFKGQRISDPLPKELMVIINKFLEHQTGDYLLSDSHGNQLTPVKLNQRINKIFDGRHVSCNMFRHSFLSEQYKNIPGLAEMQKTADNMGHSLAQALEYVKKIPEEKVVVDDT